MRRAKKTSSLRRSVARNKPRPQAIELMTHELGPIAGVFGFIVRDDLHDHCA
jgi:hypothetical protein